MDTRAPVLKAGVRVFIGLSFAVTAAAKAADYYGFIEKAVYYRGFSYQALTLGAWTTILIEVLLAALFLGGLWVRRLAAPLALAALTLFSSLILYAWRRYGIDDCACLGSLAETPPWAGLAKNIVLMALVAWLALRPAPTRPPGRTRLFGTAAMALAAGAAASLTILSQTQGW